MGFDIFIYFSDINACISVGNIITTVVVIGILSGIVAALEPKDSSLTVLTIEEGRREFK